MGSSFFHYFHPLDAAVVDASLRDLYVKGQVETPAYRFLAKDGSVVWIVSQWTVVRDSGSSAAAAAANAVPAAGACTHGQLPLLTHNSHSFQSTHPPAANQSANLQHHVNQSQSSYILSVHFVIR